MSMQELFSQFSQIAFQRCTLTHCSSFNVFFHRANFILMPTVLIDLKTHAGKNVAWKYIITLYDSKESTD